MAKRGAYSKTPGRRDDILDATLEVFARSGYHGLSLKDVAESVGMSQAGLLHHFGSREAMLAAILERREELARAEHPGRTPIAALADAMRHNREVPGLVQLHSVLAAQSGDADHAAHDYFGRRYETLRTKLELELARRVSQRGIDLDPVRTAPILIALADGLQVQWMLDPSLDMGEHFDYLLALIGIEPEGTATTV